MSDRVKGKIQINGKDVSFFDPGNCNDFLVARKRMERKDYCAITNEPLIKDNDFYLIIGGQLFPNCFGNKHTVDQLGFLSSTELIIENWEQAKELKHWFD